jgi:type I restriction enzyme M protein
MANQKNETALIKKVKDIANVMASAGVGFTDYITQLTYILFLKMDAEKEELGLGSSIPDGYKWKDIVDLSGDDLVEKYEEILKDLSEEEGLIGTIFTKATNKISRPVMLKEVFKMVAGENWYMMEGDLKGAIYERILEEMETDNLKYNSVNERLDGIQTQLGNVVTENVLRNRRATVVPVAMAAVALLIGIFGILL